MEPYPGDRGQSSHGEPAKEANMLRGGRILASESGALLGAGAGSNIHQVHWRSIRGNERPARGQGCKCGSVLGFR